jgi:hypothetical protein
MNPVMSANDQEAHVNAFEKVSPGTGSAIRKAVEAGVPWAQIIAWVIQYGPAFAQMIADLINKFKPTPPTPTPPAV